MRALSWLAISLCLSLPAFAAAGLATPGVSAALDTIARAARASRSDAVLVMQGGKVLLEYYPGPEPGPIELMSVTKSVVALGIGALVADGHLRSLDTPVHVFFPEWKQGRKQDITVRMLMDHSSGLQNVRTTDVEIYPSPDVVQLALSAELSSAPATEFRYNNKATNLLAGVIERAAGEPMDQYIDRRLFTPLGIRMGPWNTDRAGNPYAMAGLALTARDLARLGRLVIDEGRAGDRALLDADYIGEMLGPSRNTDEVGLLWWRRGSVRFHADAESFASLERVGAEPGLIDRLRPLDGQTFASEAALYDALAGRLGGDWRQTWTRELIEPHGIGPWRPFHAQREPVDTFYASGDLGQYLVVVPEASLVAVRQIQASDAHAPADSYVNFISDVRALADSLLPP